MRRATQGFTLIEIAIVLVVIGLLISGGLLAIAPVIQGGRQSETRGKLDRLEQALILYVIQNGCLPCPANGALATGNANAGWSAATGDVYGPGNLTASQNRACANTSCTTNAGGGAGRPLGVVPWKTLGLGIKDATDAWGSMISYGVTANLTVTTGTSMQRTAPASYPAGTLIVNDTGAVQQTAAAAFVLVSHGQDRAFAFTQGGTLNGDTSGGTVQDDNAPVNNTGTFVDGQLNTVQANFFDDLVRWRTAPAVIHACGPNACGNPA